MKNFSFKLKSIMIQNATVLNVADNSGAKSVKCIKITGSSKVKIANIGDIITVSIKKIHSNWQRPLKIKKGQVCYGIVVQVKKKTKQKDGGFFNFSRNAIILLDKKRKPIGTRIIGTVIEELRHRKFMKSLSLSSTLF